MAEEVVAEVTEAQKPAKTQTAGNLSEGDRVAAGGDRVAAPERWRTMMPTGAWAGRAFARLAVPLAALWAIMALTVPRLGHAPGGGILPPDPAILAESRALGWLAAAVLVVVAALAPAPAGELGAGAVLATCAIVVLPAGPGRGAVVMLLLVATFAVAAGRALARLFRAPDAVAELAAEVWEKHGSSAEEPATAAISAIAAREKDAPERRERMAAAGGPELAPTGWWNQLAWSLPLATGAQLLLRSELVLQPRLGVRELAVLAGLPAAGACAMSLLARGRGPRASLLAAGTALLLGPGWTVTTTLALCLLAAGDFAARGSWTRTRRRLALAALVAAVALVLAVPFLWGAQHPAVSPWLGQARAGGMAAGSALALVSPAWAAGLALPLGVLAHSPQPAGAAGLARQAGASLLWLVLLLPSLALPPLRRSRRLALTAALLALAAPWEPGRSALAGPLALAALAAPETGALAGAQWTWTCLLLAGTSLLGGYPWLRADALAATLAATGLEPGLALGLAAVGTVLVLGAAAAVWPRRGMVPPSQGAPADEQIGPLPQSAPGDPSAAPSGEATPEPSGSPAAMVARPAPAGSSRIGAHKGLSRAARANPTAAEGGALAATLLFLALFLRVSRPATPLLAGVLVLDATHPVWQAAPPARGPETSGGHEAREIAVESSLTHAAELAPGAPVAVVRLRDASGAVLEWPLRAGDETGEWAAQRPDVLRSAHHTAPPAWISWLTGRGFAGQRYRAVWRLAYPSRWAELRIERAPDLPADLQVALYNVETRP